MFHENFALRNEWCRVINTVVQHSQRSKYIKTTLG